MWHFGEIHSDRVSEGGLTDAGELAERAQKLAATISFVQAQDALTMTGLDALREVDQTQVKWTIREDNIGMGIEGSEIPASTYQSVNAIFILIFGLVFTGIWSWLGARGREPSTPEIWLRSANWPRFAIMVGCKWVMRVV